VRESIRRLTEVKERLEGEVFQKLAGASSHEFARCFIDVLTCEEAERADTALTALKESLASLSAEMEEVACQTAGMLSPRSTRGDAVQTDEEQPVPPPDDYISPAAEKAIRTAEEAAQREADARKECEDKIVALEKYTQILSETVEKADKAAEEEKAAWEQEKKDLVAAWETAFNGLCSYLKISADRL